MQITHVDPKTLVENPWNPNFTTPSDQEKLRNSLERNGWVKPALVRELEDGSLQIIGGAHRVQAAIEIGHDLIPVVNLGALTETKAKEIGLIDNARYGTDDALSLAEILAEIGSASEIATFLPLIVSDIADLFGSDIDLDTLEDVRMDSSGSEPIEKPKPSVKTHSVMRFKVPVESQELVAAFFAKIVREQGLDDSDAMINSGDALVWLVAAKTK